FAIEIEADRHHVPVLLCSKQIADAADLHIAQGNLIAGPQASKLAYRLQTVLRCLAEHFARTEQAVCISLHIAASDPAAQLVELSEPELVGLIEDDRVYIRHVESGLDDGRADENVELVRLKVEHHVFEIALLHLSMTDGDASLRHEALQLKGNVF